MQISVRYFLTWLATALWEFTYKILPSFFGFFTSLKEIKVLLPKIGILAPSDTKIGVSKEFIVDFSQDFLLSANFLNSSKLRFLGPVNVIFPSKALMRSDILRELLFRRRKISKFGSSLRKIFFIISYPNNLPNLSI